MIDSPPCSLLRAPPAAPAPRRRRRAPALPLLFLALAATPVAPAASPRLEGALTLESLTVTHGGLHPGTASRGLAEIAWVADEPAAGADSDFTFRVSALAPFGGDLSGTHLGDLQGASNIAAYNHPLLYELWLGGTWADDRLGVRAGRLVADGDFATTTSGGVFLNSSFGWPAFISANTRNTGPAFNRSALGLFVTAQPRAGLLLQAGVYDGDSFDDAGGDPSRHPRGLRVELSRDQGAFAIAEIVLTTAAGPADAPRPGTFKLGAWHHTADFADPRDPTRLHAGNHGVYVVAEQMFWREPGTPADDGQGLTAFARTGFAPGDRNHFTQTADAGLSATGLLPGRDTDTVGLGVAWVRIGRPFRQAERAAGAAVVSDYELVVEASYDCALTSRWHLIPDVQWIGHAGGSRALPSALVLGLRSRLTF